jgi:hypothetical protein
VVEWDGLENRYARKRIEGSNPSLSAILPKTIFYGDEEPEIGMKQPEGLNKIKKYFKKSCNFKYNFLKKTL